MRLNLGKIVYNCAGANLKGKAFIKSQTPSHYCICVFFLFFFYMNAFQLASIKAWVFFVFLQCSLESCGSICYRKRGLYQPWIWPPSKLLVKTEFAKVSVWEKIWWCTQKCLMLSFGDLTWLILWIFMPLKGTKTFIYFKNSVGFHCSRGYIDSLDKGKSVMCLCDVKLFFSPSFHFAVYFQNPIGFQWRGMLCGRYQTCAGERAPLLTSNRYNQLKLKYRFGRNYSGK